MKSKMKLKMKLKILKVNSTCFQILKKPGFEKFFIFEKIVDFKLTFQSRKSF